MTCSMLWRLLPLLISLTFWRKRPRQNASDATASASIETARTVSESDASRSRELLKVLMLEREIIGTALTTIYESEVQGIITRSERDRLIDKYSSDLKALESKISEHQRIADLFDLESAKEKLMQSYREKLSEIDKKLVDLRTGAVTAAPSVGDIRIEPTVSSPEAPTLSLQTGQNTRANELKDAKTRTDKKIEAIREEVLKAMERLEQIESEG